MSLEETVDQSSHLVVQVASLAELEPGAQIDFEYPDADSPVILLRLDGPVEGGIGQVVAATVRTLPTIGMETVGGSYRSAVSRFFGISRT